MLKDLERVAARATEHPADDFRRAAAELLSGQFLLLHDARQRPHYRLVMAHLGYFEDLFDALGWSLRADEDFGLVGLVPETGEAQLALRLDETLLLLVLRLLYEEGLENFQTREGSLALDAEAVLARYEALLRRERPKRQRVLEILRLFSRQRLIERGEEDPASGLPAIHILPSIRLVADEAVRERLAAYGVDDADSMEADE